MNIKAQERADFRRDDYYDRSNGYRTLRAARLMRMSYRQAWLLLADLNRSFDQPVALTSTGGRGGGGVLLTTFGERLVAGCRKLESELTAGRYSSVGI